MFRQIFSVSANQLTAVYTVSASQLTAVCGTSSTCIQARHAVNMPIKLCHVVSPYCDRRNASSLGQSATLTSGKLQTPIPIDSSVRGLVTIPDSGSNLPRGCLHELHRTDKQKDSAVTMLSLREHRTSSMLPVQHAPSKRTLTLSAKAIVDASPLRLQPYLRLIRVDRPIGTWLLFLPSAWSLCLAAPAGSLPDVRLIALFGLGSFMMRSAGCAINDVWDKDFDAQVARTRNRPIACGEISRFKALVFLALPLSASLGILLTLNYNTIILGFGAVLPCVVYPLMKRVTYWPQAFLGVTFNYGVLMGWSAVRGALEWPVLPLYISCIAWTLVYDTLYGFQDRTDDRKIGVKSTALRFGDSTRLWLSGFTSVVTSGLVTTGLMCDQAWPYYAGVAAFTAYLAHQIYTVDLSDPADCGQKFRSNRNIGLAFWAFILAACFYRKNEETNIKHSSVSSAVDLS